MDRALAQCITASEALGCTQGRQKEGWESVVSTLERVPQAHAVHSNDVPALWTIEKAGSKASDW